MITTNTAIKAVTINVIMLNTIVTIKIPLEKKWLTKISIKQIKFNPQAIGQIINVLAKVVLVLSPNNQSLGESWKLIS